jgi:two-component system LytT family sensor kinase
MKNILRIFFIFCFWLGLYYIVITQFNTIGKIDHEHNNFKAILFFGMLMNALFFHGIVHYWIPRKFKYDTLGKSILQLLAIYLFITAIECLVDYIFIPIETKDLNFFLEIVIINFAANFIYLLSGSLIGLTILWLNNERKNQLLIQGNLKTQIKFLKSQINPHFLFNVLNTAYASAKINKDNTTADIIMDLSEMMRYMLYESDQKYVTIDKELDYIKSYLELERRRLPEEYQLNIHYNFNINKDNQSKIAPMVLIPFIENAFKHGRVDISPVSIDIQATLSATNVLTLTVKNIKNPFKTTRKNSGGIGMNNVKDRLNLLYSNKYALDIQSDEETYQVKLELTLNT